MGWAAAAPCSAVGSAWTATARGSGMRGEGGGGKGGGLGSGGGGGHGGGGEGGGLGARTTPSHSPSYQSQVHACALLINLSLSFMME